MNLEFETALKLESFGAVRKRSCLTRKTRERAIQLYFFPLAGCKCEQ